MSQGTKTKATSLEKVTAALTEHGWQFTVTEQEVAAPDKENAISRGRFSRTLVPNKNVPGFKVSANNGMDAEASWYGDRVSLTAFFTESGSFLPRYSTGSYPIGAKPSVAAILSAIEKKSPKAIAERQQANAERKQQELAEYDAKVAAAYAEAQSEKASATEALTEYLTQVIGVTPRQANGIIAMLTKGSGSEVANYLNASTQVERTAQGYIGESYAPATYVDGKRVSGSEV